MPPTSPCFYHPPSARSHERPRGEGPNPSGCPSVPGRCGSFGSPHLSSPGRRRAARSAQSGDVAGAQHHSRLPEAIDQPAIRRPHDLACCERAGWMPPPRGTSGACIEIDVPVEPDATFRRRKPGVTIQLLWNWRSFSLKQAHRAGSPSIHVPERAIGQEEPPRTLPATVTTGTLAPGS